MQYIGAIAWALRIVAAEASERAMCLALPSFTSSAIVSMLHVGGMSSKVGDIKGFFSHLDVMHNLKNVGGEYLSSIEIVGDTRHRTMMSIQSTPNSFKA